MKREEVVEAIERKRRIVLRAGPSMSHRRLAMLSDQIRVLENRLEEIDNGRFYS